MGFSWKKALNAASLGTIGLGTRLASKLLGGPDMPAAPDYVAAARETAAGNLAMARAAASANRVSQYGPYGDMVYSHEGTDPDAGWSVRQTLSAPEQAKYDAGNALTLRGLAATGGLMPGVERSLSSMGTLDESRLASMPISGQSVQDAVMSRLQPQLAQDRATLRTRLANSGLMEGSEAWTNAMREQGQRENDLYTQAALQGINTGLTARQQGVSEQYAAQDRPINAFNSMRSGVQVNTPQQVNVPGQATTQGADMLGAADALSKYQTGVYNAKAAQRGNLLSAGSTVLAAALLK